VNRLRCSESSPSREFCGSRSAVLTIAFALAACSALPALAHVELAEHIQDGMVVQRGTFWDVSGTADEGERFVVRFMGQEREVRPSNGAWAVRFDVPWGGAGEADLTIGGGRIVRKVQVGDVWFCGGQSNMAMAVGRATDGDEIFKSARGKPLYVFQAQRPVRQPNAGRWMTAASHENIQRFSAICLAFGVALHDHLRTPVGLIDASLAGTVIESWISANSFGQLSSVDAARARYDRIRKRQESTGRLRAKDIGKDEPSRLYELMVKPYARQSIKGVLWYHGESNRMNAESYAEMLIALMKDWRATWNHPSLPFVVVQLPAFGPPSQALDPRSPWAAIRDAQRIAVASSQPAALAVSVDLGDATMHPASKQPFGRRAAEAALELTNGAGQRKLAPMPTGVSMRGKAISIEFDGGACLERTPHLAQGVFVAGDDRRWQAAEATIDYNSLVLRSSLVERPVAARYGWSDHPRIGLRACGSLVPVTPFRTDRWPLELNPR
jgi:sialate O-acetylesterase